MLYGKMEIQVILCALKKMFPQMRQFIGSI